MPYIHQHKDWPRFYWDREAVLTLLATVRHYQGRLLGRMESLGFSFQDEAMLHTLTMDVLKSSEIEGEILDRDQVRSSIARHLGLPIAGLVHANRNVEGVVEMMLDATQKYDQPLTDERLFAWHASLFPTGRSGMQKIRVAGWREEASDPMQVVSGAMGKERVHFEAPDAARLAHEMKEFLFYFNSREDVEPILKAAIAHLWFVTIHPFDDGNGRMARAIADMQLARADGTSRRFYSLSTQIQKERKEYYDILEKTQKGILDITPWLEWFLSCLHRALTSTETTVLQVLKKARFWDEHASKVLNDRQRLMLNKLLDGFDGKLNTSKWAKIAKCSQDTALRDIQDLLNKGMLTKDLGGGRSTNYILQEFA